MIRRRSLKRKGMSLLGDCWRVKFDIYKLVFVWNAWGGEVSDRFI
jgi:hypothetical protein